ncbi:MAG: PAS domain S-box protein [Phycisphaeraceae bacterium]
MGYSRSQLLQTHLDNLLPAGSPLAEEIARLQPGEELRVLAVLRDREEHLISARLDARRREVDRQERIVVGVVPLWPGETEGDRLLAEVVDSSPDAIIASTREGMILTWSHGAERMYGYGREEVIGRPLSMLMPPETQAHFEDCRRRLLAGETLEPFDAERLTRDGRRIRVSVSLTPLLDESGRVMGASTVEHDVARRVAAEHELATSRRQMEAALNSVPDVILVFDPRGTYRQVYTAEERLLVLPREQMLGRRLDQVLSEQEARVARTLIRRALETGQVQTFEYPLEIRGEQRWFAARIGPLEPSDEPMVVWMARDISQRKAVENALEESEQRYRVALRAARVAAWVLTIPEGELRWSDNAAAVHGLGTQALGEALEGYLEIVHEEDRERVQEAVNQAIHSCGEFEVEYRIRPDEKNEQEGADWIESRGRVLCDDDGRPQRLVGVCLNASLRKEMEQTLHRSEDRFKRAFELGPMATSITALPEGRFVDVNHVWEKVTGYQREDVLGKTLTELGIWLSEADRQAFLQKALRSEAREVEVKLRHPGGGIRDAQVSSVPIEFGGQMCLLSMFADITERKRMEAALKENEARLRAAFSQAAVGMSQASPEGRLLNVNDRLCEILGYTQSELLEMSSREFIHPDDWADAVHKTWQLLAGAADSYSAQRRYLRKDGSTVWVAVTATAVRDDQGRLESYFAVIEDITQRKQDEATLARQHAMLVRRAEQLRELTTELAETEQRERRQIAQMLHDHLQQLLVAMKMQMGALVGQVPDAGRKTLEQLQSLLDQSIDASRSLTVELAPPVLYDAGLLAAFDWLANWMQERHRLKVYVEADPAAEPSGEAVRALLFDGVRELLFNVVKHAKTDEAWLTVTRTDGRQVRVVVEDAGQGFEPAKVSPDRSRGGFGLFSLRERIEGLGGSMRIDSRPGEGTRTTLQAPLNGEPPVEVVERVEPAEPVSAAGRESENGPVRVVLADDHQIIREGLANLLWDLADIELVGEAANGEEAVELTRRLHPDVVVMDVAMPKLSGIEATKRLRQEQPEVAVVALSFHQEEEVARRMYDAGASDYVTKDEAAERLIAAVRDAAARRHGEG